MMQELRNQLIQRDHLIHSLQAQNADLLAALEAILEPVEDGDICHRLLAGQDQHYPDCPVLQARAAIAQAKETG